MCVHMLCCTTMYMKAKGHSPVLLLRSNPRFLRPSLSYCLELAKHAWHNGQQTPHISVSVDQIQVLGILQQALEQLSYWINIFRN